MCFSEKTTSPNYRHAGMTKVPGTDDLISSIPDFDNKDFKDMQSNPGPRKHKRVRYRSKGTAALTAFANGLGGFNT